MESVHVQLVAHPQVYKERAGQTCRQSDQVDEKCSFETFEVSEDEENSVTKHDVVNLFFPFAGMPAPSIG